MEVKTTKHNLRVMSVYELEWALYKVCNSVTNGGAEPDAAYSGRAAPDCNMVITPSVFRSIRLGLMEPITKGSFKRTRPVHLSGTGHVVLF